MDAIDRKLLTLLQRDSRLTAERLADRLNLSPSAITRRIQRLWANGSISSQVVVVGERIRDKRITAIMNIQLDRHQPNQLQDLRRAWKEAPEVQVCMEITGAADVIMIVSTRDMDHFNTFADQIASNALIRRYETSFVKKGIKFSTAVSMDEE